MKDFLRYLRAAYQFAKAVHSIPETEAAEFWTEDDAKYLTSFLKSHTGQKLVMRLDHYAYKAALAAVRQKGSEAYECGEAAGIQLGITALQSHQFSQVAAQSDTSDTEENEAMLSAAETEMA